MNKEKEKKVLQELLKGKSGQQVAEELGMRHSDVSQVIKSCGLKQLKKVREGVDKHVTIQHVLDELKEKNPDLDFDEDVYFDAEVRENGNLELDFHGIKWKTEDDTE